VGVGVRVGIGVAVERGVRLTMGASVRVGSEATCSPPLHPVKKNTLKMMRMIVRRI
jgi:hypothetical protein